MTRSLPLAGIAAAFIAVGIGAYAVLSMKAAQTAGIATVSLGRRTVGGPAMCPWREPQRDLQKFFPGEKEYRIQTLVLTRARPAIQKQLGPEYVMETTGLYVYRVGKPGAERGAVIVRRAAGEHGAIEVVVGVDTTGRVAGVRIQRQREPEDVATAITSATWLTAFRGKTARDSFVPGGGVPAVPPAAVKSAHAAAFAVRALLVEYDLGGGNAPGAPGVNTSHPHH